MIENINDYLLEYLQYPKSLERLGVCTTCPSLIKETLVCQECGCQMKIKVLIPLMTCPLGKW
jgi:hypothetical protein